MYPSRGWSFLAVAEGRKRKRKHVNGGRKKKKIMHESLGLERENKIHSHRKLIDVA